MPRLTKRQAAALEYIRKQVHASNQQIKEHLQSAFGELSRVTVVRDLGVLIKAGLIQKQGRGRSLTYSETATTPLLSFFNPETYFAKGPDERVLSYPTFNFGIFQEIKNLFSEDELADLHALNAEYREHIKKLPPTVLQKEYERLTIELSWKSSQIEGNTYSLIDTEVLIKDKKEAAGHKKEEAVMILNHKKALDYIFSKTEEFKYLSLRDIENIHALLTGELGVTSGLRKHAVGITGSTWKPLDNEHQIREAMEKMVGVVNDSKDPFIKALAAILFLSYIQPFEDGNKRTARIISDAVLLAHQICPLSFRSVSEADYKKAILLFYEQNSARLFKEIFVSQFEFSVHNYFR
jgi:Fic family protein